jgi:Helix-turn-helix
VRIPPFSDSGNLPEGVHDSTWDEIVERFGTSERRRKLLEGLRRALESLRNAGCRRVYLDGSFVAAKEEPGDFDACWETAGVDSGLLDPVLLTFSNRRAAQKERFRGELIPAEAIADPDGTRFFDYFQRDKLTGERKRDRRSRLGEPRVITNERQYRITKSEARKFEEAIAVARGREPSPDVDPRIHQAMIEALESELAILRDDLNRFESLKAGKVRRRSVRSLRELPVLLIEGRIAAGLTQRQLAVRLGLPEQQIQRYESTLYSGVSLDRLQDVADALGLEIEERVTYAATASSRRG